MVIFATLFRRCNFNVDIHNVVSTLIWRCAMSRCHINLKTRLNRRWNVCWGEYIYIYIFIYIYISLDYIHRIPVMKWETKLQRHKVFRGCSYERELARLDGLPHLGEISICFRNSYKSIMCSYEKWASPPRWDLTWFSVDPTWNTPRFSSPARWDRVL